MTRVVRLRLRRPRSPQPRTDGPPSVPEADLPTVAVLTMVRDEAVSLPRWVAHYSRHVGLQHLVVLDDGTTDGSTDDLGCTVHRLPPLPGQRYERTRMELVSGLAQGLLAAYDVVVFVDADELLVPDPARHRDLRSFLAARPDAAVLAPVALNVVHVPAVEGPLDPSLPVLGQRRFAVFAPLMCKPSVKRVPAAWRWASHGIEAPFAVDPELFLVHTKFADRDHLRAVAAHRRALVEADGRARGSSWSRGPDEVVAALDRAVEGLDPAAVPELDVAALDLAAVVQPKDGWHRAVGAGQVQALTQQPVRRVPQRLLGEV